MSRCRVCVLRDLDLAHKKADLHRYLNRLGPGVAAPEQLSEIDRLKAEISSSKLNQTNHESECDA